MRGCVGWLASIRCGVHQITRKLPHRNINATNELKSFLKSTSALIFWYGAKTVGKLNKLINTVYKLKKNAGL